MIFQPLFSGMFLQKQMGLGMWEGGEVSLWCSLATLPRCFLGVGQQSIGYQVILAADPLVKVEEKAEHGLLK